MNVDEIDMRAVELLKISGEIIDGHWDDWLPRDGNELDQFVEVPLSGPQGFAAMPREAVQKISAKGGRQAHINGTAHTFSPEEAKKWGPKGGKSMAAKRKAQRETP